MYINIYACNVRVFTWLSVCLCLIGARGDGMTLFNLQQTSSSRNLWNITTFHTKTTRCLAFLGSDTLTLLQKSVVTAVRLVLFRPRSSVVKVGVLLERDKLCLRKATETPGERRERNVAPHPTLHCPDTHQPHFRWCVPLTQWLGGVRLYRLYRLCRLYRLYRLYRLCRLYRLYRLYRLCRLYGLYRLYRLCRLYRLYRLYLDSKSTCRRPSARCPWPLPEL